MSNFIRALEIDDSSDEAPEGPNLNFVFGLKNVMITPDDGQCPNYYPVACNDVDKDHPDRDIR
jgi:hypothetical protein